eukprot:4276974-Alexandrium_andersonii.AAC.1
MASVNCIAPRGCAIAGGPAGGGVHAREAALLSCEPAFVALKGVIRAEVPGTKVVQLTLAVLPEAVVSQGGPCSWR